MIRCAVFRGSTAAGCLPAAKRFNSTIPNGLESQSQYPEKENVSSASPKPHLPISPLMDPSFISARETHHRPKARPDPHQFTPFQQQLRKNPYALALATPVRMCKVTKTALPRFFLQDYNLLANPETGDPWWMPSGSTRKQNLEKSDGAEEVIEASEQVKIDEERDGVIEAEYQGKREAHFGAEIPALPESGGAMMGKIISQPTLTSNQRLLGPTIYTIARKDFLNAISNKRKIGYGTELEKQFIDTRLLKNPRSRQLFSKARWRTDIDEFLLELMRRRIVEDLSAVLGLKRGYVVGCKDWDIAFSKTQTGAFLWTGHDDTSQPSEFATIDMGVTKEQKVPIHNLKTLLGEKKLEHLRAQFDNNIFDVGILALRHRRRTVDLQMKLWRLQGYLAEYKENRGP